MPSPNSRSRDRQIVALALPALATLIAEPAFLLADTAIVARLGTDALAGLALGGTVMATVIGLCIFLAYGTTATTARLIGAGRQREGLEAGFDGLWLGLGVGLTVALVLAATTPTVIAALGGEADFAVAATHYVWASLPGLPFMLVSLAASGVLRGLLDTRTPLVVTTVGLAVNAILNWALVFPVGLGIVGSGVGTSLAQAAMGISLAVIVARKARAVGARLSIRPRQIVQTARAGVGLVIRSVAMRVTHLSATAIIAGYGAVALATHQLVLTLWGFAAFALDAIAIAGQALVGRALGAERHRTPESPELRAIVGRMVQWGWLFGAVLGAAMMAGLPLWRLLFDSSPEVAAATVWPLVIASAAMPLAGYVFVLDGILIGAGDGRYLGITAVINTLTFLPLAALASWPSDTTGALVAIWLALAWGWMASRAVTLRRRVRSDAWLR